MSEPLRFTLPVTVGQIRMKVDRSVSIQVNSAQEIDDDEFHQIHKAFQRMGWFLFSETNIHESEIPKEDIDRDVKSRAQMVRNKTYRLHKLKEDAGEDSDFDALYRLVTGKALAWLDNKIADYD